MVQNSDKIKNNDKVYSEEFLAKLAFLGSAITFFGDSLSLVTEYFALENLSSPKPQNDQDQTEQLQIMQNQIDELAAELAKIKASK